YTLSLHDALPIYARLDSRAEPLVFAQKNRAARQKIRPLHGRIAGAALVPHESRRHQQDFPRSAPDLRCQVGIAAAPRGNSTATGPPAVAGRQTPVGGRLPSGGAGCPSSSTSIGQTAAASACVSRASARRCIVVGCTSVSSCRKNTYSASAARQPRFSALVRPKFFGRRMNRTFGKSSPICALPSRDPL